MIYKKSKMVRDYEDAAIDLMFTKMLFGAKQYNIRKSDVLSGKYL